MRVPARAAAREGRGWREGGGGLRARARAGARVRWIGTLILAPPPSAPHLPSPHEGRSALVTGGAGFIGSHLVDHLLAAGARVTVIDDLSSGTEAHLVGARSNPRFLFVRGDVLDRRAMREALAGCDLVYHCAADPEVRITGEKTEQHLRANVTATHQVLEAMREARVARIVFTSTSTVYGEATEIPTPETYGPMTPISVYGASKLASESLISAYCATFDLQGVSLRFANVAGARSNHGVTFDFVRKLRENPKRLEILGDGRQAKSYVHIDDTVRGILAAETASRGRRYEVFNIGSGDMIDVLTVARVVAETMGLKDVEFAPTGGVDGGRGWKGDVRTMRLSADKLRATGWAPRMGSTETIRATASALLSGAA